VNQLFQKDLDTAATDRDQAQVMAYRERIEANKKAHQKFASADDTFVKDVAEAKSRAMNLDPIIDGPDSQPVASTVGGIAGAIVDAVVAQGVGEALDPTAEDAYWQRAFITEPYFNRDYTYDDYGPAYRLGYNNRGTYIGNSWDEVEPALKTEWERTKGASRLTWEEAREAGQSAWHHAGASVL
jgi:hypothetical protein